MERRIARQTKTAEDRSGSLTVLRVTPRIELDVVVTTEDQLMTFVRLDGALIGELHVAGNA